PEGPLAAAALRAQLTQASAAASGADPSARLLPEAQWPHPSPPAGSTWPTSSSPSTDARTRSSSLWPWTTSFAAPPDRPSSPSTSPSVSTRPPHFPSKESPHERDRTTRIQCRRPDRRTQTLGHQRPLTR